MSNGLIIFLYCITVYGLSNMVVFADGPFYIFSKIRELANSISEHFGKLFSCMICFPANVGWVLSLVNWFFIPFAFTPFNILLAGTNLWWLAMICDCCFTSGIVWIIHNIESFFESIAEGKNTQEYEDIESDDTINVNMD